MLTNFRFRVFIIMTLCTCSCAPKPRCGLKWIHQNLEIYWPVHTAEYRRKTIKFRGSVKKLINVARAKFQLIIIMPMASVPAAVRRSLAAASSGSIKIHWLVHTAEHRRKTIKFRGSVKKLIDIARAKFQLIIIMPMASTRSEVMGLKKHSHFFDEVVCVDQSVTVGMVG